MDRQPYNHAQQPTPYSTNKPTKNPMPLPKCKEQINKKEHKLFCHISNPPKYGEFKFISLIYGYFVLFPKRIIWTGCSPFFLLVPSGENSSRRKTLFSSVDRLILS